MQIEQAEWDCSGICSQAASEGDSPQPSDMIGDGLGARLDWLEAWLSDAVRRSPGPGCDAGRHSGGTAVASAAADLNIGAAFRFLTGSRGVAASSRLGGPGAGPSRPCSSSSWPRAGAEEFVDGSRDTAPASPGC